MAHHAAEVEDVASLVAVLNEGDGVTESDRGLSGREVVGSVSDERTARSNPILGGANAERHSSERPRVDDREIGGQMPGGRGSTHSVMLEDPEIATRIHVSRGNGCERAALVEGVSTELAVNAIDPAWTVAREPELVCDVYRDGAR